MLVRRRLCFQVRNFIVEAKRRAGKITVQELLPELSDETSSDKAIFVNEFFRHLHINCIKKLNLRQKVQVLSAFGQEMVMYSFVKMEVFPSC